MGALLDVTRDAKSSLRAGHANPATDAPARAELRQQFLGLAPFLPSPKLPRSCNGTTTEVPRLSQHLSQHLSRRLALDPTCAGRFISAKPAVRGNLPPRRLCLRLSLLSVSIARSFPSVASAVAGQPTQVPRSRSARQAPRPEAASDATACYVAGRGHDDEHDDDHARPGRARDRHPASA